MGERYKQTFLQGQMANKLMKRCLKPLGSRKMQIKATMRYHFSPTRKARIKKSVTTSVGKDAEKSEPPMPPVGI